MRELLPILLVMGAILAALVGAILLVASVQCNARWAHTERQTEWGVFSGCLVESNDRLVPEDRVWYERNQ